MYMHFALSTYSASNIETRERKAVRFLLKMEMLNSSKAEVKSLHVYLLIVVYNYDVMFSRCTTN